MAAVRTTLVYAIAAVAGFACSGCVRSETRGAPSPTASGAIEGRIVHPGQIVPALRICAIGGGAPEQAARICVRTRRDQTDYRIENVPAGDYIVVAQAEGGATPYRLGGHMQQVQCIRAPCPSVPATVMVGEGARATDIDLNEFFAEREGFPTLSP